MKTLCSISIFLIFCAPAHSDYADWRWQSNLPKHVIFLKIPDPVRDPIKIDQAFEKFRGPIKFKEIIKVIGRPHSFSPQSIYSLKKGGEPKSKKVDYLYGTYRYLLKDGGEAHIWVLPGGNIGTAIRFEKNGKGHLLYK